MTPYAVRLEQLREELGIASLQEFVDTLNGRGEEVPYATARRYHRDREPPVSYLVSVADVFGARIEWLVTGKTPLFENAAVAAQIREEELRYLREARRIIDRRIKGQEEYHERSSGSTD